MRTKDVTNYELALPYESTNDTNGFIPNIRRFVARSAFVIRYMLVLLSITAIACQDDDDEFGPPKAPTGNWPVRLSFHIDNQPLIFDSVLYTNAAGNNYGIHLLQFYLSDFEFTDASGNKFNSDTVVYADARYPETLVFNVEGIPPGSYTGLSFRIGMDSLHNMSNCLPPTMINMNMAWPEPMGGGYHFLKLEGTFMDPVNTYGYAMHLGTCPFAVPVSLNRLMNYGSVTDTLQLSMNINEWFSNPEMMDFNAGDNYTMGNDSAMAKLSANGTDVFN